MTDTNSYDGAARRRLIRQTIIKLGITIILLGLMFFLAAGSLSYWQAWVLFGLLLGPMTAITVYLLKNNPRLLERRTQMREKEPPQMLYIRLSVVVFAASWTLPGFDHRWGWSSVPTAIVLLADVIFLAAYLWLFWVMKTNSYASRTVEVVPGQEVVTTGPYAFVRHPMYLGILVMYGASPLALGSYWAFLAYLPLPFLLGLRILNEEVVLLKELPGYAAYCRKIRYRLIPFLW